MQVGQTLTYYDGGDKMRLGSSEVRMKALLGLKTKELEQLVSKMALQTYLPAAGGEPLQSNGRAEASAQAHYPSGAKVPFLCL